MEPVLVIIVTLAAIIVGLGLGYLLGTRQTAPYRDECETLRARCGEAEKGQAVAAKAAEVADSLRITLDGVRDERDRLAAEAAGLRPLADRARQQEADLASLRAEKEALAAAKAAFERGEEERAHAHAAQLAQLRELEAKVEARFGDLAAKAVDGAHDRFLKQAEERFGHAGRQNEAKLRELLQPVEATLKSYDEKLGAIEKDRVGSYGELREAVRLLDAGHRQVRDETRNLVNALRSSPKSRGRWGEQSLKNVLEQAGLSPYADFRTEVSVDTDDGRLRPDVVVSLPGGRKLIIDAKCSLNAFLDASDEVDDDLRKQHLRNHVGSIRRHAEQLGSKAYWQQFGDAADYVVMYIPGEHFLTAALEQDDNLWAWAFERRVLLATPTNLVAIARTVASVWRQEKIAEQAAEIAALGKELHSRISTMGGHIQKLGNNLRLATDAYNSFAGSVESQVLTQAKRFEALEVAGAKQIEPLPLVEKTLRPLTKLTTEAEAAE